MQNHQNDLNYHDILPDDVWKWNYVENVIRQTMELYNFKEIRTSILQSQELFKTYLNYFSEHDDLTNHLLFNLNEVNNLSLRPEGTITVLHSLLKNQINDILSRLFYIGPMFRRKNMTQFSQFHQFGAEIIGSNDLLTDNEIILLAIRIFKNLEIFNLTLELSSFGCDKCRPEYLRHLNQFVNDHQSQFCNECQYNIKLNPLQVFQCVDDKCKNISEQAPAIINHLCEDCSEHLKRLQRMLSNLGVSYLINPFIHSAFNYYNRTIFNFTLDHHGHKHILANGGRYDMLAKSVTGKNLPAIGFSANLELIIKIMDEKRIFLKPKNEFRIVIAPMSDDLDLIVLQIVQGLHDNKVHTQILNYTGSFQSMQSLTDDYEADVIVYVTEDMIRQGKLLIKNNLKSHQEPIYIADLNDYVLRLKKAISII
ncbi:MAG TPA: ATP phosphoribosyltransferase regulatory subunit [Candidatus Cloacimonadota bacterium]|nr:ATP phosphoribosyltransferase regulatory subunit [Candidatus Cloacimonadota bacterium]